MFQKDNQPKTKDLAATFKKSAAKKLMKVIPPKQLLALERRRVLIAPMAGFLALGERRYQQFAETLLENIAARMQELPATRNSYFACRGGFLEYALSRASAALSLARAYFVNDEGREAATLSESQQRWMYALFSAALLRGVGKLVSDFIIETFDDLGGHTGRFEMLAKPLYPNASMYEYDYEFAALDPFKRRLTLVMARHLMPEAGFLWLASDKEVLNVWLALLDEDARGAGTLGMILDKADGIAVKKFLQERALAAYAGESDGQKFNYNAAFADKPAVESTDLTEGALPKGAAEFLKWLTKNLASGKLTINQSLLFLVPGGMLLTADMFKLFMKESTHFKSWQAAQQALATLHLHEAGPDGEATQRFMDCKSQTMHSGMVFSAMALVLPEQVKMLNRDNGVVKSVSATQVMQAQQSTLHLNAVRGAAPPLQVINAQGKMSAPVEKSSTIQNTAGPTSKQ